MHSDQATLPAQETLQKSDVPRYLQKSRLSYGAAWRPSMIWNAAHLPYWILLALGLSLFAIAIVGSDEADDPDFDPDSLLASVGLGQLPLLILLALDFSLWGFVGWSLNVIVASISGSMPSIGVAVAIFVVSLLFSLWLGRLIAKPIGQLFATFGEDASSDRLIGCTGTVSSKRIPTEKTGSIGQVDLVDARHTLVTVSAICPDWATETPRYGQMVLAIDLQSQGYLVIVKDSVDETTWFSRRGSTT